MKKMLLGLLLLTLTLSLALTPAAFAESSPALQAAYNALTAEGSDFSQAKAAYAEYYEGVSLDAALEDHAITITLNSASEYVEAGSWTFTEDGDYLTAVLKSDDFVGASLAQTILAAAVSAQGVNASLFNGYLSAMTLTDQQNKYLLYEEDEAAGTAKIGINIAGPFEMEGLDELILTEDVLKNLGYGPLDEQYTSTVINFGKVSVLINGSAEGATLLVMEYGELDNLAFQDIITVVKTMQPKGWEEFIAAWTELEDAHGERFSVTLNADPAVVAEILEDTPEGYSCAIVRLGGTEEE